ncbi:porin [Fibrella sp. WM1]|uniref:porin n=1 Tax=Fibrella musci TaxID=3242485 RepID=UPI0035213B11
MTLSRKRTCLYLLTGWCWLLTAGYVAAQQRGGLTESQIDTTQRLIGLLRRYEFLNISGYIQPQFQLGQTEGQRSFNGGDFPAGVDDRFSVRRGRLRLDYARYTPEGQPKVLFVFQFDGTERGMQTRDFWGRLYDNRFNLFHLTAGLFARPFGFEVNYGSGDRESPERGRMSQLLMRTERDLGAMISFEPRVPGHPLRQFKLDIGLFNGPGLASVSDYDTRKDVITRLALKPLRLNKAGTTLAASVSGYFGGIARYTNNSFRMASVESTAPLFVRDTSAVVGRQFLPRQYYGADLQLRIPNRKGFTEFRAEYVGGWQTSTQASTETPGVIPNPVSAPGAAPLYVRRFNGAYFYYLQHLGSLKHQLVVKYDWYDPNKQVSGQQIDNKFSWADLRYDTIGFGYLYYMNENLKIVFWYDVPINESSRLTGYTQDVPDNLLTIRTQYRF